MLLLIGCMGALPSKPQLRPEALADTSNDPANLSRCHWLA
jgi:hypothetical protein